MYNRELRVKNNNNSSSSRYRQHPQLLFISHTFFFFFYYTNFSMLQIKKNNLHDTKDISLHNLVFKGRHWNYQNLIKCNHGIKVVKRSKFVSKQKILKNKLFKTKTNLKNTTNNLSFKIFFQHLLLFTLQV